MAVHNDGKIICHKGTAHIAQDGGSDDECWVKQADGLRYFNFNQTPMSRLKEGSTTVLIELNPVWLVKKSWLHPSGEDHAGKEGGVNSHTYKGAVKAVSGSVDVLFENEHVVRTDDPVTINKENCEGTVKGPKKQDSDTEFVLKNARKLCSAHSFDGHAKTGVGPARPLGDEKGTGTGKNYLEVLSGDSLTFVVEPINITLQDTPGKGCLQPGKHPEWVIQRSGVSIMSDFAGKDVINSPSTITFTVHAPMADAAGKLLSPHPLLDFRPLFNKAVETAEEHDDSKLSGRLGQDQTKYYSGGGSPWEYLTGTASQGPMGNPNPIGNLIEISPGPAAEQEARNKEVVHALFGEPKAPPTASAMTGPLVLPPSKPPYSLAGPAPPSPDITVTRDIDILTGDNIISLASFLAYWIWDAPIYNVSVSTCNGTAGQAMIKVFPKGELAVSVSFNYSENRPASQKQWIEDSIGRAFEKVQAIGKFANWLGEAAGYPIKFTLLHGFRLKLAFGYKGCDRDYTSIFGHHWHPAKVGKYFDLSCGVNPLIGLNVKFPMSIFSFAVPGIEPLMKFLRTHNVVACDIFFQINLSIGFDFHFGIDQHERLMFGLPVDIDGDFGVSLGAEMAAGGISVIEATGGISGELKLTIDSPQTAAALFSYRPFFTAKLAATITVLKDSIVPFWPLKARVYPIAEFPTDDSWTYAPLEFHDVTI